VSAVVCTYTEDRWPLLERAVESLLSQEHPPLEVIVVIDHNPALHAMVQDRFPTVRIVDNDGPRGASASKNAALAAARGELLAFLDDDAAAPVDWIHNLAGHFAGHDEIVGVGTRVSPEWVNGRPRWFRPEFDWIVGCSHRGLPETTAPVRNAIGSSMAVRREPAVAIGGFNPDLGRVGTHPVGCEETEFFIRARQHDPDAVVLYDPGTVVRHHVPESRASAGYYLRRCWHEGESKAAMARLVGTQDGLSAERSYVARTLPLAVVQALVDLEPTAAIAVVLGTAATTAAYLNARLRLALRRPRPS
jgi:GT2 family glycosyltransferase